MSIINYFVSSAVQDFVAVFDQNFDQVFPLARILKPVVKPSAVGMEHPIESGTVLTDHVIIKPLEIELGMIITGVNLSNTYQTIYNYFQNRVLFTISTKTADYPNMYILEMPHEEDPDLFDAISITLKFKQALIAPTPTTTSLPVTPATPTNSTTVDRGNVQPVAPSSTVALDAARQFSNAQFLQ